MTFYRSLPYPLFNLEVPTFVFRKTFSVPKLVLYRCPCPSHDYSTDFPPLLVATGKLRDHSLFNPFKITFRCLGPTKPPSCYFRFNPTAIQVSLVTCPSTKGALVIPIIDIAKVFEQLVLQILKHPRIKQRTATSNVSLAVSRSFYNCETYMDPQGKSKSSWVDNSALDNSCAWEGLHKW